MFRMKGLVLLIECLIQEKVNVKEILTLLNQRLL